MFRSWPVHCCASDFRAGSYMYFRMGSFGAQLIAVNKQFSEILEHHETRNYATKIYCSLGLHVQVALSSVACVCNNIVPNPMEYKYLVRHLHVYCTRWKSYSHL